jgi:salicylate hydroxylase
MNARELAIAICGCGPAGLAAALFLHRSGHRVALFERFESAQPVGSGLILQPTGLAVLSELDAIEDLAALGAPIDRLFGRAVPSQRVVLDVRYAALGAGWRGLAVHRATLFNVLHEKVVARGIPIHCGITVLGTRREGAPREGAQHLLAAGQHSLGRFDLIVDAMGANSPFTAGVPRRVLPYGALWANVPWPSGSQFLDSALEQRYRRAERMAGILPVGRQRAGAPAQAAFFWSLKRDQLAAWQGADLLRWKDEVAQLWPEVAPLLEGIADRAQLTFARYDHFTRPSAFDSGLVHVGDSARATSPQLGQGANMALLDALALEVALKQSATLDEALALYGRMRRWHTRLFQWASAAFTPFYQSDSRVLPWVRDWLAAPLSRAPVLSQVLARLVSGSLSPPFGRRQDFKPHRLD